MKHVIITLSVVVLAGLAVVVYLYAGGYNVAASKPHSEIVHWFLTKVRDNSIQTRASGVEAPPLDDVSKISIGLSHYQEMCVTCHGAPGIEPSETGQGLYPPPPDLAKSARELNDAELFWIVKNGIKMTGMPAYGPTHDDEKLWDIVAFLRRLPDLSAAEYQEMITAPARTHEEEHAHGESGDGQDIDHADEDHSHEPDSEAEPISHAPLVDHDHHQ